VRGRAERVVAPEEVLVGGSVAVVVPAVALLELRRADAAAVADDAAVRVD
jgi:hypothetical protein